MQHIWGSRLDDRYECEVNRLSGDKGQLTVKDTRTGYTLLDETVPLAFDARFGPDLYDVEIWQDKCVQAVEVVDPSIVTLH